MQDETPGRSHENTFHWFSLCAWVLWQQHYINDKKIEIEPLNAYGQEANCKNSLDFILESQRKQGREVVGATVKRKGNGDGSHFAGLSS